MRRVRANDNYYCTHPDASSPYQCEQPAAWVPDEERDDYDNWAGDAWCDTHKPRDSGTELTEQLRASVDLVADVGPAAAVRTFSTGATRDTDQGKLDYEGFLSPLVLTRFAEYMHKNRRQSDGTLRASDNWQKGIPIEAYMKSTWRHFVDLWRVYRGHPGPDLEESLCALMFNVMGYLHEHLKGKK